MDFIAMTTNGWDKEDEQVPSVNKDMEQMGLSLCPMEWKCDKYFGEMFSNFLKYERHIYPQFYFCVFTPQKWKYTEWNTNIHNSFTPNNQHQK